LNRLVCEVAFVRCIANVSNEQPGADFIHVI
jgi:hypothetical protein